MFILFFYFIESEVKEAEPKPFGFFKAWTIPGVPIYAIGYTCIKSTNYGILFWLSYFLKSNNLHEHASAISQTYEVGEIIGGLTLGSLNDRYHKK